MNRNTTLLTLLLVTSLGVAQAFAAPGAKPNIIFILADDLGIGNVGCYGSDNYKTPNIDKLAAEGTRFMKCFTAALCGPSRALILSGRYAFRNGSSNQDACTQMPTKELRVARTLKTAGYVSSAIGKWGQLPGEPNDAGFDDYLRFNGSGVYRNTKPERPERYSVNGKEKKLGDKEYMPDLLHEHMMGFIKKHQKDPFFIYYCLSSVHGELLPTPDAASDRGDLMADNILFMDKLIGKLVSELEALNLREKTLLVFMGDNGTGKAWAEKSSIAGRQLSGMKGSMLECGGLVPMIANWPSKIPTGNVCNDLIDSTDLLPTFAQLAGAKLPEGDLLDGHSFAPLLLGTVGKPREWIYNQLASMWYVRDASWKLNEKGELFDMSDAPFTETLITADTPASHIARTKLATVLAKLNPAGGILDNGDGTGRHANKNKNKEASESTKPPSKPETSDDATLSPEQQDRATKFARIDSAKHGKVTLDEYQSRQSDPVAAKERFEKYDTNKDGFVSRDEYISRGK
ncbi:MAG: sulfatase-like hydrolase/transferase [Pirellulaceae bacterium]|nr:sulfatase-like hydrolase/transferase [Pirellulaceae bacterium]